jgi:HK97 family phage major capsid protein
MTLQEMLQRRSEIEAEMGTILETAAGENRGRNEDERKRYDELKTELATLDSDIAERQEIEADQAKLAQRKTEAPPISRSAGPAVIVDRAEDSDETKGYRSFGEFLHDVVHHRTGELEAHGVDYREQSMGTTTEGGFLVPTGFIDTVLEVPGTKPIVRSRATVIPAGDRPDAAVEMPALDQTGAGNMYGGVAVTWVDEELTTEIATVPETDAAFKKVSVQAKGVQALVPLANKLVRNTTQAEPIVRRLLGSAVIGAEDYAFLSGDGNAKPTGVRSSTGMIYVNRTTASTVTYADLLTMLGKLHPDSVGSAVFVASQSLLPTLSDIKDAAGNRIYHDGDPTKGIPSTLLGIPVVYTGKVAAKGAKGDLLLVDFTYYLIKDGVGLTISASEHVRFETNRTVIKVLRSVDGKGWVTGAMYLEDGVTTVSPYVGLDIPAVS